jgi:hypothetical protein
VKVSSGQIDASGMEFPMRKSLAAAVLIALLAASSALAQVPQPPAPLDAATRQAVVTQLAAALRNLYVFPEVGDRAAAKVEAQAKGGAYDGLQDPRAFADRLTADLAGVAHDKHLRVMVPGGPPPEGRGPPPRAEAGVVRADLLAGNVGYLEVSGFPPLAPFKPAVDRAMASLDATRALIIDLRRNGGGVPESVDYLASFFVDPAKPMHLTDIVNRTPNTRTFQTTTFWSVATPTGYLNKPVYVLTSARTFSGGEGFAYDMKTHKLGVLVGETTGGGANPGGVVPLPDSLGVFLPRGRSQSPITGTNWEGVGVVPDVAVPAETALHVALQKLGDASEALDIDALSKTSLFQPRAVARSNSEPALRQFVTVLSRGAPDYDDLGRHMSPSYVAHLPDLKASLDKLGALKSLTFSGVGPAGADIYRAAFAGGEVELRIALGDDGAVEAVSLRPLS